MYRKAKFRRKTLSTKNFIWSKTKFINDRFREIKGKEDVKGFLNLFLKIALKILKLKQTMLKDTSKNTIFIYSQVHRLFEPSSTSETVKQNRRGSQWGIY